MASIGHIAVGMAAARAFHGRRAERGSIVAGIGFWSLLSLLPDLDVIGFRYGVRYTSAWGHRGVTHSLLFCLALGLSIGVVAPLFRAPALRTALFAVGVLASHALLDTLTDGGLGCALFWPFDRQRYFAGWRPIPVAPIGRAYFSSMGLRVAAIELALFMPLLVYSVWPSARGRAR